MTMACRKRVKTSRILRAVSNGKTSRIHGAFGIRHPQPPRGERSYPLRENPLRISNPLVGNHIVVGFTKHPLGPKQEFAIHKL
jgi:hypothetical protein